MKLYKQNGSALLFEKINALGRIRHNSWRCIHFNFAGGQYSSSLRNNFVLRVVGELLADTDANIYACEDGDIFILFQGLYEPMATRLGKHFDEINPDSGDDELLTVFDLSQHWQLLHDVSRAKCLQPVPALKPRTMQPAH